MEMVLVILQSVLYSGFYFLYDVVYFYYSPFSGNENMVSHVGLLVVIGICSYLLGITVQGEKLRIWKSV